MNMEPTESGIRKDPVGPDQIAPPPRVRRRWYQDLLLLLGVWGLILVLTVPFFNYVRRRGPEMLERIKERDPQYDYIRSEAYYARGKLYFAEGKYEEAAFYFQKAGQIDTDLAGVPYYLGLIHKKKKEWNLAEKEFEVALNRDSNHVEARLDLADLLAGQGKTYAAVEILLTLEDLLPEDSPIREGQELYRHLVPLAQDLFKENPDYFQAALILGRDALRQEDYPEAENLFKEVLLHHRDNEAALLGMVDINEKQGDSVQAVERLVELIQKHPNWIMMYDRLQTQSEQAGKLTEGITAGLFRPLTWLNPEVPILKGPLRSGMQLIGFDYIRRPTLQLNLFDIQLHWNQEQGMVWETEREQVLYRLQDNLFAHRKRLFDFVNDNPVPNPGFECSRPGNTLPAEWPGEFIRGRSVSEGWIQVIEEDLPSQKINRYIRLNGSRVPDPSPVGLLCRRFPVKPERNYLLGFRYRSRGGNPSIKVRFVGKSRGDFVSMSPSIRSKSNDWETFYDIVKSPEGFNLCFLVLENRSIEGTVDYDDLFMIELRGLD